MAKVADPTAEFLALVGADDADVPLDRAAGLLAAHARPDLDLDELLGEFDRLAERARERGATLGAVTDVLFREVGLSGNRDAYYDPANSYLDEVLRRRTGIPITLSVVLIEVARRVGIPLVGIGMPAHFLTRTVREPFVYLDAFDGGRMLDERECGELFRTLSGGAELAPGQLVEVGSRAILARMLANLKAIALQQGDRALLTWVLRLRVGIPGVGPGERRELAAVLASGGRFFEAADELETLAAAVGGPAAEQFRAQAATLRARLN